MVFSQVATWTARCSQVATGRMANESMSAIENVDGLDDGMADGMELLPPPETAPAPASADEKLHAMQPGISVEQFEVQCMPKQGVSS